MRHFTAVVAVFVAISASTALADIVVFEHVGSSNPISEGWSVDQPGAGASAGPITNDAGTGFDAWFVDDNSSAIDSYLNYRATPNALQLAQGNAFGWTLSANVRVPEIAQPDGSSTLVAFSNGSTQFQLAFFSDSDGDPVVRLRTGEIGDGPTFTLEGGGTGEYHLYELVSDPVLNSADLFVNGIERISDYEGKDDDRTFVRWGSAGSVTQGRVHYNSVRWSVAVPEPSSAAILLAIGVASCMNRRRGLAQENKGNLE